MPSSLEAGWTGVDAGGVAGNAPAVSNQQATSHDAVQAARAAGTIDEKTAALYELLALFSPSRLPSEYQVEGPIGTLGDVAAMRIARTHLDEYTPTQAAAVEAMLADPEDPNWLIFPADMPARGLGATAGNCRTLFSASSGGGRFVGSPILTNHFSIRALLPTTGDVAKQEAIATRLRTAIDASVPDVGGKGSVDFGTYLDHVYEYYRDTLKMKEPSKLKKPAANGGRIPIYVATCDGSLNDAFAEPNDGFVFTSIQLGFEETNLRRVALPHEIFHVFESAYEVPEPSNDSAWPVEACAVAVEDLVAPGVRRYTGAFAANTAMPSGAGGPMDRSFKCPEEPIHTAYGGACKNRAAGDKRYDGSYSKFVLIKFLMRNHGLVLGDFWTQYAAKGGDPKDLIPKEQLVNFELALLGDVVGKPPFFDADDRAAFNRIPGLDLPTGDNERYTFRSDPSVVSSSKSFRFAPALALSKAKTLSQLDAKSSSIPAGGTHRILLEIPDDVRALVEDKTSQPIQLVIELQGCSNCAPSVAALSAEGAGPGRLLDPAPGDASIPATLTSYAKQIYDVSSDKMLPTYVMATISNLGDGPVTWKAGFTLVEACRKKCLDYYEKEHTELNCPEYMCQDYKDAVEPQYDDCIEANKVKRSDGGLWCGIVCNDYATGAPYRYNQLDECPDVEWRYDICSNGGVSDCSSMPGEFVPIPDFPRVSCHETVVNCGGSNGCFCNF